MVQQISKHLFILSNTSSGYKRGINTLRGHFFKVFYYLKFMWKPVNVKIIEFPVSYPLTLPVFKALLIETLQQIA